MPKIFSINMPNQLSFDIKNEKMESANVLIKLSSTFLMFLYVIQPLNHSWYLSHHHFINQSMHIQSPSFINNIFIFIKQMKPIGINPNQQGTPQPETSERNKPNRNSQSGQNWVGVHIDNQYFLTTPSAFEKLQNLDMQIAQEKQKLNGLERQHQIQPADDHRDYRQKPQHVPEVKQRKNSIASEASRQCRTEINQLKALKAKINAEKQLVEEQMKYQNKTIQVKKRRELKQSTTFVIRNPKDHSIDGSERKKKTSVKKFMIAPHQLASGRKFDEKEQSRVQSRQIEPEVQNKEKVPINKTIEPKITRVQESGLLSRGNTVKMSINSKDRYNQNFQNPKSKQKSFIITSRKQFSTSSKQHRDSMLSGVRDYDEKQKLTSKSQIDKLSTKLRQMQEKLLLVEKKQKELEQFEQDKQKRLEKSRQKSYTQSRAASKINQSIAEKSVKKQENFQIMSAKKPQVKKQMKPQEPEQPKNEQKNQELYLIEELKRKEKKLKKLNISSEIIAYNYRQDLQKQIKEQEQVDVKSKMSDEITQLKKIIKQLKIDKIKQEAKIQDLEEKDQNRKINNFIDSNNSQITFNGEDSKAASSIRENTFFSVKQSELSQDQIDLQSAQYTEKGKYFLKKQPRRILKVQSNKKSVLGRLQQPISAPPKNNNYSLNSSDVKNNINQTFFNPEDQRTEVKRKGIIIRQIINQEKFNTIDVKSEKSGENGLNEQSSYQHNSQKKQTEQYEIDVKDEVRMQQFQKPDINSPEIQILEAFPIPDLPSTPLLQTSQSQILVMAQKICEMFEIKVDNKQQLQFKKFKNCVILKTKESNKAIVWHFSGKFYIGGWDQSNNSGEDHKHGEGFQFVPGKHYYRGQFQNGKRNGHGTMIMLDGDIYKGEWKNGERHGQGICYEKKINSYYQGQWKEGKKTGVGIFKVSDKEFYQGQFEKSVKTGSGVEMFSNGDLYIGQYKNGKFDGKGKYFWANGSAYGGNFVDGNREGEGKWTSSIVDGDVYIGTYKKDRKEGKGKYIWNKGCTFEGEFKADLKHGEGRVQYQDGREVKGLWQFGKLKTIYKSEIESQSNMQSQASLQIEPRIRPNMPRIIETPSRQMQESKFIHGV